LQKVATFSVALSLTIAWSEMNIYIVGQYERGEFDAFDIRKEVLNGKLIKASRVISDTFLWLAQTQTLIRLFPRHREKIAIKWTAFALILMDTVFSIVNAFFTGGTKNRSFLDVVPTLSYLLQIALSFLYASCVVYYAFAHRQFSFLPRLSIRNTNRVSSASSKLAMPLMAVTSISAILIPIVFFVLDISNPLLAGWGDFVRWVGAAAASVVVWEWVDRIEGFEELARKRGILGRQVFDGDEMLPGVGGRIMNWDALKSNGGSVSSGHQNSRPPSGDESGGTPTQSEPAQTTRILGVMHSEQQAYPMNRLPSFRHPHIIPPLSRATTASTSYAIRIHQARSTPPVPVDTGISRNSSAIGGETISDLAISNAGTPSNDPGRADPVLPLDQRQGDVEQHDTTEELYSPDIPQPAHIHRTGQQPFNPEDFATERNGKKLSVFQRGMESRFNIFKRKRLGEDPTSNDVMPVVTEPVADDLEANIDGSHDETGSSARISEGATRFSILPSSSSAAPAVAGSSSTRSKSSLIGSVFQRSWDRRKNVDEPLPITYIPALKPGMKVDLAEVERARQKERERLSASPGQSPEDQRGDDPDQPRYITMFGSTIDYDNMNVRISGGGSTEPDFDQPQLRDTPSATDRQHARAHGTPSSLRLQTPGHPSNNTQISTPPISPTFIPSRSPANSRNSHQSSTSTYSPPPRQMLNITQTSPPPPPASTSTVPGADRANTVSPPGSHRSTSSISWQYRGSPVNAPGRTSPGSSNLRNVNNVSSTFDDSGIGHTGHQNTRLVYSQSPPPATIASASSSSAPSQRNSITPKLMTGTVLEPAVIPEEAENGSIMSSVMSNKMDDADYSTADNEDTNRVRNGDKGKGKASDI